MAMHSRTRYTPPYTSSPSDPIHREGQFSPVSDHDGFDDWREELNYYLENDMVDDFWYDEEDRHELF